MSVFDLEKLESASKSHLDTLQKSDRSHVVL